MEIPFEIVTHTEFRSAGPGEGLASFTLSQPPMFFLEHITSPRSGGGLGGTVVKTWKKCSDWTEGTQASHVMRHDLIGSAVQLAHVLNDLREYRTRASIPLLNPAYNTTGGLGSPSSHSPTTVQIPQPPLASLQGDSYSAYTQRPAFFGHMRKRSSSGPPAFNKNDPVSYSTHYSTLEGGMDHMGAAPHSAGFASTSFDRPTAVSSFSYGQRSVSDYMTSNVPSSSYLHQPLHDSSTTETSTVPISHGASHRPFSSGPNSHFFPPGRDSPPFSVDSSVRSPVAPPSAHHQFLTPSPPIAGSSYGGGLAGNIVHSTPSLPEIGALMQPRASSAGDGSMLNPPIGLPGLPYYGQDDSRIQEPRTSPRRHESSSYSGAHGGTGTSSSPHT